MSETTVFFYALFSGLTIFLGGLLGRFLHVRDATLNVDIHHTMVAFAGGVLFAAVALVLTPPGIAAFSISVIAALFVGGAACFALLTVVIERAGGKYGQVLALLSDFAPEAVALGAVFMSNPQQGALLAFFVGLQNFPEGYSAYCELRGGKSDGGKKALVILFALAFIGPIAALSGWHLLSMRSDIVAAMMLFAGGGIVYLTFQDIAPQALRKGAHWPALGAAAGFFLGIAGTKLIH